MCPLRVSIVCVNMYGYVWCVHSCVCVFLLAVSLSQVSLCMGRARRFVRFALDRRGIKTENGPRSDFGRPFVERVPGAIAIGSVSVGSRCKTNVSATAANVSHFASSFRFCPPNVLHTRFSTHNRIRECTRSFTLTLSLFPSRANPLRVRVRCLHRSLVLCGWCP